MRLLQFIASILSSSIVLLFLSLQVESSSSSSSPSCVPIESLSSPSRLIGASSSSSARYRAFYPGTRRRQHHHDFTSVRPCPATSTAAAAATTTSILSRRSNLIQTAKSSSRGSRSSGTCSHSRWGSSPKTGAAVTDSKSQNHHRCFHPRYPTTATATIQQGRGNEPTLEELRAQLSPISLLISNAIELTVITLGSYLSGGLLGYLGGAVMGIPSTLLGKTNDNMGIHNFLSRLGALHAKAMTSSKSWATLSASFSGFNNLARLCRGEGNNDHWNAVLGSAMTGAFLNRKGGMQAMIQGGATYAAFTYVLDKFFGSSSSHQQQQQQQQQSSELMFTDFDIDD